MKALRSILCATLVAGLTFCHATAATARDFLWKVSGKTGTVSVYLVGSVHMLTEDFYPLSKAFEEAFKDSDLLVEEADLAECFRTVLSTSTATAGTLSLTKGCSSGRATKAVRIPLAAAAFKSPLWAAHIMH